MMINTRKSTTFDLFMLIIVDMACLTFQLFLVGNAHPTIKKFCNVRVKLILPEFLFFPHQSSKSNGICGRVLTLTLTLNRFGSFSPTSTRPLWFLSSSPSSQPSLSESSSSVFVVVSGSRSGRYIPISVSGPLSLNVYPGSVPSWIPSPSVSCSQGTVSLVTESPGYKKSRAILSPRQPGCPD